METARQGAAAVAVADRNEATAAETADLIETPLARDFFEAADNRDAMERELTAPQLVRRLGRPAEVAKLACFLASDDAAFITGASYVIEALAWRGVRE